MTEYASSPATKLQGFSGVAYPSRVYGILALIALLSFTLRLVFFTGFFGSDDVNFAIPASEIAEGRWLTYRHIGYLRYGITLPMAFSVRLFGFTEFAVNLWPLVASIAEVALVFLFAQRAWGLRAALLSSALIGLSPLHVHFAGRIMGDAPMALLITLSFILFRMAEERHCAKWYFATGVSVGAIFWMKEVVLIYTAWFGLYLLVYRTWKFQYLWLMLGAIVPLVGNGMLMHGVTGDPLHYLKVLVFDQQRLVDAALVRNPSLDTPWWFYFWYMFVDLRHSWLLFYLAFGGLALWAKRYLVDGNRSEDISYVVVWGLGLFAIFTFGIFRINPVTLIFKQTNYMLIFWAPFSLLAGWFLAQIRWTQTVSILVVVGVGSIVLAALEQQAIRVFTSNSRQAWAFAKNEKASTIYAPSHVRKMAHVLALMEDDGESVKSRIRTLSELARQSMPYPPSHPGRMERDATTYVILDRERMEWGKDPRIDETSLAGCLERIGQLEAAELGIGSWIARGFVRSIRAVAPPSLPRLIERSLASISEPTPAIVYRIPATCIGRL
jgi:hypothetical protein